MNEKIIFHYVDAATEQLLKEEIRCIPGHVPEEMRDYNIPKYNDWVGWKPVPSNVTDDQLDEIEKDIGAAFPPAYRVFLKYKHFYGLTEIGIRFCRHPLDKWRSEIIKLYQGWDPTRIVGVGLIPFGNESLMDAGPVCFDTRNVSSDGDCPVVFWDHESVGTLKEIQPMFSSCMKMFECLLISTTSEFNFVYHDEDDPPEILPPKLKLMTKFLDIDPEGAGGPARGYWTNWGVNPDA